MRLPAFYSIVLIFSAAAGHAEPSVSHPPLRPLELISKRPLAEGRAFFVDEADGNDSSSGAEKTPWRTIAHAVKQLKAGDTLYLRAGVYYENVYLALTGEPEKPITIRSYPAETAIIDGGLREFFASPETSWEPVPDSRGEYRSKDTVPNLRNVCGSFGDSMIGLQTYYHAKDLRSRNEQVNWPDWENRDDSDIDPLYCGPGLWYEKLTGRIHLRLAHTNLPEPIPNYRGETDPRKVPLILAPFDSVPLAIDAGAHLRLQDLVIRGAGYSAVELNQAFDIEFDNVTIWCGTYGIRASGTRSLRIFGSGLYGNVAPWTFRGDGSKRDYPGRPHRNISRLNTHALMEIESGNESSVYAFPQNDDWEMAWNDFTDAHDGIYLGGINVKFHHNRFENLQDDGIYLSPMYLRHRLEDSDPQVHIYENEFRQLLTALAFGGPWPETRDQIFICRNVFDLRYPVSTGRPSTKNPEPGFSHGKMMGDHGSPPWPAMNLYHNTVVTLNPQRRAAMGTLSGTRSGNERRSFNNVFYHLARLPGYAAPVAADNCAGDANLYATALGDLPDPAKYFGKFRASDAFGESREIYPPGTSSNSLVADPQFEAVSADTMTPLQLNLRSDSPALNAGIALPEEWPDPLRDQDKGKPDLGAFPLGVKSIPAGRSSRP